jgi:LL-diaminopimelate aminotransferase
MKLAKRLDNFPEYIFSKLGKKRMALEAETGRKVLDLSIGSPDYPPSKEYIDQLKLYLDDPKSHLYPGYGANAEFTSALQAWYQTRFGTTLAKDELFPLLGGKDGVSHIALALLDEGDEVLIPDPGYPGFAGAALMVGAKPVYYNLTETNDFNIDLAELEEKVTDKTKFIWVNFPSNPTGQVATIEELEPVVAFAKKHDIVLVYDNAYAEITFDGFIAPSILQIPGAIDSAVELGSFSKTYSFAGHRMGWIVGNAAVIGGLAKVKSQVDSGMFTPLQRMGAYALTHEDKEWKQNMLTSYRSRRNILAAKIESLGLTVTKPQGSLYLWARIPDFEENSEVFCFKLLEEKYILVAPGTAFGENGKRFVRISISANIENIEQYFT